MGYTAEDKATLRALFITLAGEGEIWPTDIVSDGHCEIGYSDRAKRELAGRIIDCAAFDALGINNNFLQFGYDSTAMGLAVKQEATTGYAAHNWIYRMRDAALKFMRDQAMSELTTGEIFTRAEMWEMIQHSPKWASMEAEYEAELAGRAA